jgi:hypothetical protein
MVASVMRCALAAASRETHQKRRGKRQDENLPRDTLRMQQPRQPPKKLPRL